MENKPKSYMQEYYEKNKDDFTKKLRQMEKCKFCKRNIQHTFMSKHLKTKICKKIQQKQEADNVDRLQNQIMELKKIMSELKVD